MLIEGQVFDETVMVELSGGLDLIPELSEDLTLELFILPEDLDGDLLVVGAGRAVHLGGEAFAKFLADRIAVDCSSGV